MRCLLNIFKWKKVYKIKIFGDYKKKKGKMIVCRLQVKKGINGWAYGLSILTHPSLDVWTFFYSIFFILIAINYDKLIRDF